MNDNTARERRIHDNIQSVLEIDKYESTEEIASERSFIKNIYRKKQQEGKESVKNYLWGQRTTFPVDSIRRVARELARKNLIPKRRQLNKERNILVKKMFNEGLSREEEKRLEFIRWQLDRIDDAEIGENVDLLERLVIEHEKILQEIDVLLQRLR